MSMYKTSKPSASLIAKTKLQHDWSSNRCVQHINSDWLDELLSDPESATMHSMVKIRLLLAGLLALDQPPATAAASSRHAVQQQAATRAQLQGALQKLRNMVSSDADEWDKVMAAAAGPMDGRLDLELVMQRSPAVQESMTNLAQLVAASSNQQLMAPLEDAFLRELPSVLDPGAAHFVVRARPRVQPLSAGVSYAQATPPPPSLLRAQGAHQSSAAAAAGTGQSPGGQKLARHKAQQGVAGAAGLARAKSGQLTRQHTVQILDDEQQQAELFKNTHHKHGVAAAVRHEQRVAQPSERAPSTQQGQQDQQQQVRRQQQQLLQQQQQEEQRPKGRRFNIYGSKPAAPPVAAAPPAAAAPVQRVQKQRVDQMIDDLFDDDAFIDDRPIDHIIAPTGGSRTVRTLQHKYSSEREGDEKPEGTPDDLLDDLGEMGASQVGDEQQQQQQGQGDEEMQDAEEGVEVITTGDEAAAAAAAAAAPQGHVGDVEDQQPRSAAKRRRAHVIASDSEDDD